MTINLRQHIEYRFLYAECHTFKCQYQKQVNYGNETKSTPVTFFHDNVQCKLTMPISIWVLYENQNKCRKHIT